MGYITKFELSTVNELDSDVEYTISKWIDEHRFPIVLGGQFDMKWYNWKDDLEYLSSTFPGVTFLLEGNGEADEDVWRAYARGGTVIVHKPEIVWPPVPVQEIRDAY